MVQLRLHTYDSQGNEIVTLWAFNALDDQDAYNLARDNEDAADGSPRRRPYDEREVRELTLGAGLLRSDANWQQFRRMLRSHKIEWQRTVNQKQVWLEYALDEQSRVTLERVEQISRLRRKKITLIQVVPLSFRDFENASVQLQDSIA